MISFFAKKFFGSVNDRFIKKLYENVEIINQLESSFLNLSDDALRLKTHEFKERLAQGQTLDQILNESFALVREASKRVLNMRHFDVQLIGGMVLHQGMISEMKTGEGKTLVSTLPCYLNALTGKNVNVVTVNDYLAKRDALWVGKVHEFLGLSVGCITNDLSDQQRRVAYNCDVTYATNNELGFDYLRDNMKYRTEDKVQRDHFFAIVDEVDSILIDEARTPLIISGPTNDNSKLYEKINNLIPKLQEDCIQIEEKDRSVFLTDKGVEKVEDILKKENVISQNASLYDLNNVALVHHINQALKAHKVFKKEVDYIIKDSAVVIIDEFTGRMQEGRRFSDGLHQALEAKEGVFIKNENQTLASITFQNYFRLYNKLAGMTGTASTEAVEFDEIYGLRVVEVPTNRSVLRVDEDDEIYKNEKSKNDAIIRSIKDSYNKKQPVLVGTTSIEKSEALSKLLKLNKLPHNVLNAKYHEKEAEIISQAGRPSAITIATNMAGRGTDIVLGGNPEQVLREAEINGASEDQLSVIKSIYQDDKQRVIDAGGLFVIGCERHESRRIDNQLRGRSGRQGDPGRSKFFLSLEDDLMRMFGSDKLQSMLSSLGLKDDEAIFHPWITRALVKAQQKVESRNYEIRKNLLKYDDVVNQQRKNIFNLRNEILNASEIYSKIENIKEEINEDLVARHIPKNSYYEQWNINGLKNEVKRIYGLEIDLENESKKDVAEIEILNFINQNVDNLFSAKKYLYGEDIFLKAQKEIFLITLDAEWKDHLLSLDKLRYGINLRAYAQKDPLMEYKKDAFNLFEEMMLRLEEQVIFRISHMQISQENSFGINSSAKQKTSASKTDYAQSFADKDNLKNKINNFKVEEKTPGRNESCPCGSGKKYKYCCLKNNEK